MRLKSKWGSQSRLASVHQYSLSATIGAVKISEVGSSPFVPVVPEVGVLSLVPDHWSEYWQPRHQVLTRLARYFHVVWVNPAHELCDALKRRHPAVQNPRPSQYPGFTVYDPELWLPRLYRPRSVADFALRHRLRHARDLLIRRGVVKLVLYIWRPEFARALELTTFDISCYHVDDEYSFSVIELPVEESEAQLLASVNQVFVHSSGLMDRKGKFNPNTELISNGVDFQAYAEVHAEPADLAAIPRPRIGYTGWLKKQLDWQLLLHLTECHPDWSFVLVGPQSPHFEVLEPVKQLKVRRNVYLLGAKSTEALASYPQHFDVCIMPYAVNDYTKYIYPLKLHEYLAGGRPTVGARIRSLEPFAELIGLAITPEDWSAAIRRALSPASNTPEQLRARQAVARQHDWQLLVRRIALRMAQRLGPEYAQRLEAATGPGCSFRGRE